MDNIELEIDAIIETTTHDIINTSENTEITNDNCDEIIDNSENTINNIAGNLNLNMDSNNIEVFNVALHQYLKVDEEIKKLLEAIKLRNKTKRQLAETLGTYLQSNNIKNVSLGGSYKGKRLETKVSYSSKGFSKEKITEIICEELKQETEIFEKIMESIGRTNVITEKLQIKICSEKDKSKNKIEKANDKIGLAEELLNDEEDEE